MSTPPPEVGPGVVAMAVALVAFAFGIVLPACVLATAWALGAF